MTQKKPPIISDEERQLFRDAVAHIKPWKPVDSMEEKKEITVEKSQRVRKTFSKNNVFQTPEISSPAFSLHDKQPDITGQDILSFSKPGLQHRVFAQLKQGKMRLDATLDLHEHTTEEAIQATHQFLTRCQQHHCRTVCIIHGKGHFSADNKPVLKNVLNTYLRAHPSVLAFHSAKNTQGGTGALIVLLKSLS